MLQARQKELLLAAMECIRDHHQIKTALAVTAVWVSMALAEAVAVAETTELVQAQLEEDKVETVSATPHMELQVHKVLTAQAVAEVEHKKVQLQVVAETVLA
jgi:hypothetical protein